MSGGEIGPEVVERMVALVRHAAVSASGHTKEEARAIAALLPEPVDPDLVEARKLVAERNGNLRIECGYRQQVLDGQEDDHPAVINTLAAIKRGRELERAGK
jgi:hypothetical protein